MDSCPTRVIFSEMFNSTSLDAGFEELEVQLDGLLADSEKSMLE